MRALSRTSAVLIVALVLSGCDVLHGIRRGATLTELPPLSCIESAIRSVPSVDDVRHETAEGGRPLTLTGLKPPEKVHYFIYRVGETGAVVHINIDYKGQIDFYQGLFTVNSPPPQLHIDVIRPVMIQIEQVLERRCGVPTLSASIEESCTGVLCTAE